MPRPTRLLLWHDNPDPYVKAIAKAGLAERVRVDSLSRKESPTAEQMTETELHPVSLDTHLSNREPI